MSCTMIRSMSINIDKKTLRGSFANSNKRPLEYNKGGTQFKRSKANELVLKQLSEKEYFLSYIIYHLKNIPSQLVLKQLSEKEYFLSDILYNFSGGMFRLTSSVSVRYVYALSKILGGVNVINEEVFNITKVILEGRELTVKEVNNIKKITSLFELYLKEKDVEISEVVELKNGKYLLKQTSKNLITTDNKVSAKVFKSRKELHVFKNEYKEYIA